MKFTVEALVSRHNPCLSLIVFFHLGNCMKIGGPSTQLKKKKLKLCIYFAAHDIDFSNSWEAGGGGGGPSVIKKNKG